MGSFTTVDYAVLLTILLILSAIGLYYRFTGGRQTSTEEYLLGDRNQHILPVALSLVASHMSGIAILGVPAEVYYRGGIYCIGNLSLVAVIPLTVHLFLPVFFKVGSSSAYELRFGRRLRMLASITYPLQSILFMAVVLYAPALALETLSGLSTQWSILIVGSVCTFYSGIGGIKAVIMTDVFQFILTNLAVVSIILATYLEKGSFSNIWKTVADGGRLNFASFSLDPTERHTWWSLIIGATFTYMGTYAVHQAQIQRYLTLKDYETAKKTLYISWPITSAFSLTLAFAGLCLYSHYLDCDPLKNGAISSQDQLVPFFVVDALGHLPGVPGLMVAGIFSASLSSISANLNSLATVSVQDYIKPVYLRQKKIPLSEKRTLVLSKVLACLYGVLLMMIAYLARFVAGILQTGLTLVGLVGSPMLAVFILGLFVPSANEPGAIAALLSGLAVSMWLSFGGPRPPITDLPVSTLQCPSNTTVLAQGTPRLSAASPSEVTKLHELRNEEYFYLHRLSYWWSVVISCILALVVGYLVSLFANMIHRVSSDRDPDLFSPPIAALLTRQKQSHKRKYDIVQYRKNEDVT